MLLSFLGFMTMIKARQPTRHLTKSSGGYKIYLRNSCPLKIRVALRYKDLTTNTWKQICNHGMKAGSEFYATDSKNNKKPRYTKNTLIYIHAETYNDGVIIKMKKNKIKKNEKTCGGKPISMSGWRYRSKKSGNFVVTIKCHHMNKRALTVNSTNIIAGIDDEVENGVDFQNEYEDNWYENGGDFQNEYNDNGSEDNDDDENLVYNIE